MAKTDAQPRYSTAAAAKLLGIHPNHLRTLSNRYHLPIGTRFSAHAILYSNADLDLVRAWRQTHRQGPPSSRPDQVKRPRQLGIKKIGDGDE